MLLTPLGRAYLPALLPTLDTTRSSSSCHPECNRSSHCFAPCFFERERELVGTRGVGVERSYCCYSCSLVFLEPFGTNHWRGFLPYLPLAHTLQLKRTVVSLFFPGILSKMGEHYRNVYLECSVWPLEHLWGWSFRWFVTDNKCSRGFVKTTEHVRDWSFEPVALPDIGEKDPSWRNWEEASFRVSVAGIDWPVGTVSGATSLASVFLKFRCWEVCPWICSLVPKQPWPSLSVPPLRSSQAAHLTAECGHCLRTQGWHTFPIWDLEVYVVTVKVIVFDILDTFIWHMNGHSSESLHRMVCY